ncbi:FxLYD domain-containing protein [Streptomyces sp. NPDC088726]|uniref:FxLYD domain-containing protein n=1 Tax=Streptomyces sp. NPDC088726 TaxID=3365874 RepID=UPI003817CF1E
MGLIVGLGCGGLLLLVVIIGVIVAVAGGGDSGTDSGSSGKGSAAPSESGKVPAEEKEAPKPKGGAEGDITVTGCVVNSSTTWPAADVEIVNHSGAKSNYIVSIEFVDKAGTRLGEGMAAANNVTPGQKVRAKAQGLAETSGKVSCKISKVTRYPSG